MNPIQAASDLANQRKFLEAIEILENFLCEEPRNAKALYTLGMCFSENNEPDKAIKVITKALEYNSTYPDFYVSLGYAYSLKKQLDLSEENFLKALELDENNAYALRNLGGLYGIKNDNEKSLLYLTKAYRIIQDDPHINYGLGLAYEKLGDIEKAVFYFKLCADQSKLEAIRDLSQKKLTALSVSNIKSKGFRTDAMFYMLGALKLFQTTGNEKIREISFEIAMKGANGFDIENPAAHYTLNSIPGEFSGLQLVSYMYVGFQIIDPSLNVGIDLSDEYKMAQRLFK